MSDEAIKDILVDMGVYSLVLAYVGSEAKLIQMFQDDFEGLMQLCSTK